MLIKFLFRLEYKTPRNPEFLVLFYGMRIRVNELTGDLKLDYFKRIIFNLV